MGARSSERSAASGDRWSSATTAIAAFSLVAALGWVAWVTAGRIADRVAFPYDLLYWPDDYFFTVLMKIDSGDAPYSRPAEANSWIYSPGGPYLHWVILRPFGLVRSFVANKVLAQVWLLAAIGIGTWAGWNLASASGDLPATAPRRALFVALVAQILALAAFTNPVADSLHPANLELCFIGAAVAIAARWPAISFRSKLAIAVAVPALAVAAKQTAGVTTCVTLSLLGLLSHGGASRRLLVATLPPVGMVCMLAVLNRTSHGWFWAWCYELPRSAPWEMWKVRDFKVGLGLTLYPALAVVVARTVEALARRSQGDFAWLRALVPIAAYTPLGVVALLKALGGPNNITVLSFQFALLVAPALVGRMLTGASIVALPAANLIALLAFIAWLPQKRVPQRIDYLHGETLCEYFAARSRCGEKVLLPRGAACHALAGVPFPRDRAMPAMDVAVADRPLAATGRLDREEYDLVLLTDTDLRSPWLRSALVAPLHRRYAEFAEIEPGQSGDLWLEGWGDFMAGPVHLFERRRERGRHKADGAALRCE